MGFTDFKANAEFSVENLSKGIDVSSNYREVDDLDNSPFVNIRICRRMRNWSLVWYFTVPRTISFQSPVKAEPVTGGMLWGLLSLTLKYLFYDFFFCFIDDIRVACKIPDPSADRFNDLINF